MKRTVQVKTLVVGGAFLVLVVLAMLVTRAVYIPGALGVALGLAFLLGRWSTT